MGGTRVLVGTRKGAFLLTSDERRTDWTVQGPHFPGWEIYHLKGSPLQPDRLYASQSSGWFGQVIHRGRVVRSCLATQHNATAPSTSPNRTLNT